MEIMRFIGDIQFVPLYTCCLCGLEQTGSTRRISVGSVASIDTHIRHLRNDSYHMPIGWSYNGEFKCPDCLKMSGLSVPLHG